MFTLRKQILGVFHDSTSSVLWSKLTTSAPTIQRQLHVATDRERKDRYSVGLIGCGRIAGVHLKNILRNRRLDLKWIIENDQRRVQEVKKAFYLGDGIPFYTSDDRASLLANKGLDATIVISPTHTHPDYICDSLKHGKPVFTEKPAAESVTDIRRCYETAENTGLPLLTGFVRRFDPAYQDAHKTVKNGSLGKLQAIKSTSRDSPKPSYEYLKATGKGGCNVFSDMGVHDVDMLVWLTDARRPESIYVTCHAHDPELQECGQPDSLACIIKYGNGILVTMDIFLESIHGYDMRLEVIWSRHQITGSKL